MSQEQREELASLYVLGLLEGPELAALERELAADPALATLVAELEDVSVSLAAAAPRQTPPAGLKREVMDQIENLNRSTQPTASTPWLPWAIAAALAIFCGLLWNQKSGLSAQITSLANENSTLQTRLATLDHERARLEARVNALESEKNDLQVRVASLESNNPMLKALQMKTIDSAVLLGPRSTHPITLAPQAQAPAAVKVDALWAQAAQLGVVDLDQLPALPNDKDYQMWILPTPASKPISAGLVVKGGARFGFFQPGQTVTEVAALAISIEPKGGSTTPQGPIVYVGKF